jgi:serine/threonine protein kinase
MLPFAYWRDEDTAEIGKSRYDVKLLNYDMSWHANAKGQAIAGNIEEAGYYAPEQISQDDEASRTTLVDSYGVGMSLFYAFSRISPPTGGSTTHDWKKLVFDRIKMDKSVTWRSACNRLRRIILQATLPEQSKRISVTQISLELELLSYTATSQTDRLPIDFWAEELICRAEDADYEALPNGYEFKRDPRPGRIIGTQGDIRSNAVKLYFKNSYSGLVSRSGIDKVWSEKLGTAREILTSTGWEVSNASRYINREILLHAEMSLPDLQANFEKALQGFIRGISTVRID